MSDPKLFPWGREGVPGEVDSYLYSLEVSARLDAGETIDGPRNIGYSEKGVETLAERLLAEIRTARAGWTKKKAYPKLTFEIATWTYLLAAYCAKWNQPAPAPVLRLIFEALALKEGRASPDVHRLLGTPGEVENLPAFLEAAARDGEADAAGEKLDLSDLARATGVQRDTIRRWRQMKNYKHRRQFVAYMHGKHPASKGGD